MRDLEWSDSEKGQRMVQAGSGGGEGELLLDEQPEISVLHNEYYYTT